MRCCYHAVCLYFDAHLSNFAFCLLLLDYIYILYMTYTIYEADFLFRLFFYLILLLLMKFWRWWGRRPPPSAAVAATAATITPTMYQIDNNTFGSERVLKSLKATSRMRILYTEHNRQYFYEKYYFKMSCNIGESTKY